jgi:nucleoside-diphosphate-sugar epimerase
MIIGNGLMAKAFSDYKYNKSILIFASGVSNSLETRDSEFEREFELLKNTIQKYPRCKLVYFSTISIEDPSVKKRPYIQHKINIENYIIKNVKSYLICRVSNVVGKGGNEHTIMNYLVDGIKSNNQINVWNKAERNIIDIDDVKFIVDSLLGSHCINKLVNVAARETILVTDILGLIEDSLNKKATVNLISNGTKLNINVSSISELLKEIEIKKGNGHKYIKYLLKKYY